MSWIDTDYEKSMRDYFIKKLGETDGANFYSKYESVRNAMEEDNFLAQIQGQEPNLSDHSAKHIRDVFRISYKVLGDDITQLSCHEAYCFALMILFHDVGNIYGRKKHNDPKKIIEVYNKYRTNPDRFSQEKIIIAKGASAHTGLAKDGSSDTLKYIKEDQLDGEKIDLVKLAALLRFADELAEGKQRTCSFMIEKELFGKDSQIYHNYAEITEIRVDKKGKRIAITYNVNLNEPFNENEKKRLEEILLFSFTRAIKLDIERRYTKHYTESLKDFRRVEIQYNFIHKGVPLFDLDLPQIVFEDKYPLPGDEDTLDVQENFKQKSELFKIDELIKNIDKQINPEKDGQ